MPSGENLQGVYKFLQALRKILNALQKTPPSQGGGGLTLLPVRTMRLEVPERELSSNLRKAQVCGWE